MPHRRHCSADCVNRENRRFGVGFCGHPRPLSTPDGCRSPPSLCSEGDRQPSGACGSAVDRPILGVVVRPHGTETFTNSRGRSIASTASNAGKAGRKASMVFAGPRTTTTATGKLLRFCSYSNPRSLVTRASKPAAATYRSNSPFSTPLKPMYAAVNMSCPGNSRRIW